MTDEDNEENIILHLKRNLRLILERDHPGLWAQFYACQNGIRELGDRDMAAMMDILIAYDAIYEHQTPKARRRQNAQTKRSNANKRAARWRSEKALAKSESAPPVARPQPRCEAYHCKCRLPFGHKGKHVRSGGWAEKKARDVQWKLQKEGLPKRERRQYTRGASAHRDVREAIGITPEELSKLAGVGRSTVYLLEANPAKVSREATAKILNALEKKLAERRGEQLQ